MINSVLRRNRYERLELFGNAGSRPCAGIDGVPRDSYPRDQFPIRAEEAQHDTVP